MTNQWQVRLIALSRICAARAVSAPPVTSPARQVGGGTERREPGTPVVRTGSLLQHPREQHLKSNASAIFIARPYGARILHEYIDEFASAVICAGNDFFLCAQDS